MIAAIETSPVVGFLERFHRSRWGIPVAFFIFLSVFALAFALHLKTGTVMAVEYLFLALALPLPLLRRPLPSVAVGLLYFGLAYKLNWNYVATGTYLCFLTGYCLLLPRSIARWGMAKAAVGTAVLLCVGWLLYTGMLGKVLGGIADAIIMLMYGAAAIVWGGLGGFEGRDKDEDDDERDRQASRNEWYYYHQRR